MVGNWLGEILQLGFVYVLLLAVVIYVSWTASPLPGPPQPTRQAIPRETDREEDAIAAPADRSSPRISRRAWQQMRLRRRVRVATVAIVFIVPIVIAIGLSTSEPSGQRSPTTTVVAVATTPSTPGPTTSITTSTVAPTTTSSTTSVTTTTAPTTTTLAPVGELAAGLFCRDLEPLGYSYADAIAYWTREGRPDRMDADRNGIPCETVYASAEVLGFWGDPLPTSTVPPLTMAGLESYVGEQWRAVGGYAIDRDCRIMHGGSLTGGAVAKCVPSVIGVGEYPVLTALILDDAGSVAVAEAGLRYSELNADFIVEAMGPGKFCRDVLDLEVGLPFWIEDPELRYFGAVLYWFMEGRPDRMDADTNGIPCETLVPSNVVTEVWNSGYVGEL